jgi:hypothetical protein
MSISPQDGHGNFVASSFGGIVRLHDVHVGIATLTFSLKATPQGKLDMESLSYMCYLLIAFLRLY